MTSKSAYLIAVLLLLTLITDRTGAYEIDFINKNTSIL